MKKGKKEKKEHVGIRLNRQQLRWLLQSMVVHRGTKQKTEIYSFTSWGEKITKKGKGVERVKEKVRMEESL